MAHGLAQVSDGVQGRYTLERELGRGGMATVYLAQDHQLHRPVALKLLRPEVAGVLGPERFRREIELLSHLSHPHILALYDAGETAGRLWYAMPYVDGESLRQRLEREPQLPVADVVQIVAAVAGALDYAHHEGVIHRDIKPENILLARDPGGGAPHVLVADFGVARALHVAGGERLTETGLVLGTPAYMSPEQAASEGRLDGRSDLYALGCVAYEMLAGMPPFAGPSAQAVMARHAVDPVPPLRTVRPAVPQPAAAAVERALAKVPADRFTTAGEFARALTAATLVAHGSARRRRLAAAVLVVGLSIAAVLGAVFGPAFLSGGVALLGSGKVAAEPLRFGERSAKPTIAILPFTSPGSDAGDDYLASGMHQEMISHLGMLGGLTVIDRPSVMQYRDTIPPVATIVKQLGADYVLLGQVRHDSGGVGIAVELSDARTGRTVWDDSYQRRKSEAGVRAIRTDVVQGIAGALNVKINSVERARISGRGAENAAAYDLFARATRLDYAFDPSASAAAAELLAQAIALDSGFAEAVAGLGAVYWARSYMLGESRSWADSALQLARRAIHLDPALPAAYHVLGLSYLDQGRLGQAAATYSDIARLNPNDGQALKVLGWIELLRGRLAESMALLLDAHAVAPLDEAVLLDLAVIERLCGHPDRSRTLRQAARALAPGGGPFIGQLLEEGRLGEAVSEAEEFLAAHPRSPRALAEAAKAAVASGDYLRARAHLDALSRTGPDDWDAWGLTYRTTYADVLLRVGERRRAMELLDTTLADARRLVEAGDERPGVLREIAAIYATKGDLEQAHIWLARAIDAGWRLERIHPSPLFSPLLGQRFSATMVRMEAEIQRARERIEREGLSQRLDL